MRLPLASRSCMAGMPRAVVDDIEHLGPKILRKHGAKPLGTVGMSLGHGHHIARYRRFAKPPVANRRRART